MKGSLGIKGEVCDGFGVVVSCSYRINKGFVYVRLVLGIWVYIVVEVKVFIF